MGLCACNRMPNITRTGYAYIYMVQRQVYCSGHKTVVNKNGKLAGAYADIGTITE